MGFGGMVDVEMLIANSKDEPMEVWRCGPQPVSGVEKTGWTCGIEVEACEGVSGVLLHDKGKEAMKWA